MFSKGYTVKPGEENGINRGEISAQRCRRASIFKKRYFVNKVKNNRVDFLIGLYLTNAMKINSEGKALL